VLNSLRSIAVFLDSDDTGDRAIGYAAKLSRQFGAHLIGIFSLKRSSYEDRFDAFARGDKAIRSVIEKRESVVQEATSAAGRRFLDIARRHGVSAEFRVLLGPLHAENAVLHSLHCDLVVVGHSGQSGLPNNLTAERILLETGVPVLIVPEGWDVSGDIAHVVVAWNASREARRAISDAMPFLTAAQSVTLLVVDAEKDPGRHGEQPGADAAVFLARHGAKIEVEQVDSNSRPVEEVILSRATALNSDLVIIGAYSRARTVERIFGGVTLSLLNKTTVPLLISR
jgi:nucleotide-binding universal stress UspA family protein